MAESFGSRTSSLLDRRGPLCVGIDPHRDLLSAWGLADDVSGLERFSMTVVEALADRVAVLKPQSAFFERMGSAGVAVLERVLAGIRAAGAIALLDAKRGDIGSTMAAYAEAYLDRSSPICADAVTASPFLGFGSLTPLIEVARANDGGVFVLALTSNPEGGQVQRAIAADGRTVAQTIIDAVGAENVGATPLGSIGVVIGATVSELPADLSGLNGPILAPGLGAQGGRPEDLRTIFGSAPGRVIPSTSREVLAAGPTVQALRDRAQQTVDACRAALLGG